MKQNNKIFYGDFTHRIIPADVLFGELMGNYGYDTMAYYYSEIEENVLE
jgi:hypothetical protein